VGSDASTRKLGDPAGGGLVVLYEDNHLIAVLKPANLLTQADATDDRSLMDVVKAWLKARYDKPGKVFLGLLHRLDRPVAGVVLFAKTSKGASRLSAQIRARTVDKTYRALVEGRLAPEAATLQHFLCEDEHAEPGAPRVQVASSPGAGRKEAKLAYRVLEHRDGQTLVEVALETGRKHQIRAQLAAVGHPLVGDARYGASTGRTVNEGIALCAVSMAFDHPTEGRRVHVKLTEAQMPAALRRR
jgi:23S rRNA pseudouridine1911/1915/1917 synthase